MTASLSLYCNHIYQLPFMNINCIVTNLPRERSGSVVECLTRDRRAAGPSLTGVTALWFLSKTHFPSLVLVPPRKICPYITERLLMGRKESNQTNKQICLSYCMCLYQVIMILHCLNDVESTQISTMSYWLI